MCVMGLNGTKVMSTIEASLPPSRGFRPAAPPRPDAPMSPLGFLVGMWRNPIATWSQRSFEMPYIQMDGVMGRMSILNEPAAIRHVLVDNAANYRKDALQLRVLSPGLGNGLLTAEGDEWRAQRRALAPLFTPRMVERFEPAIIESANWLVSRWAPLRDGRRLDISAEMSRLTLEVLQRTIFPQGLARDPADFARAMAAFFDGIGRVHPFDILNLPTWAPRIGKPDTKAQMAFFSDAVSDIVAERRASLAAEDGRDPPHDLLGLLLSARDPLTGAPLSEPEVNANILTFIGAGHETTAGALTWSLYLLSQHPKWRAEVEAEVDELLPEGVVEAGSAERLVRTRATFEEALRLYPPAATLSREAVKADMVAGHPIRAGETIVISPFVLQRHATLWEQPDEFLPERFMPGRREGIDRFAYLPFGAGPRICIGMGFAMREGVILLATLLRHVRLDLAPGHNVTPIQRITLRPKGGMPMLLRRRTPASAHSAAPSGELSRRA